MFSFLYRVFFDRTLFASYVKNGRGYGIKLLLILACFGSICVAFRVLYSSSAVRPHLSDEFLDKIPEIVFQNGVISSPKNEKFVYIPENKSVFLAFDTTENPFDLKDLPPVGFYVTTEAILTVSNREIRKIPFSKLVGESDFSLTRAEIKKGVEDIFALAKIFLPPLIFLLCFPGILSAYLFMAVFAYIFSFLTGMTVKTPVSGLERMRLAVLCVTPVCVINGISLMLNITLPGPALLDSIVLMVFLYCLLKDGQYREQKTDGIFER